MHPATTPSLSPGGPHSHPRRAPPTAVMHQTSPTPRPESATGTVQSERTSDSSTTSPRCLAEGRGLHRQLERQRDCQDRTSHLRAWTHWGGISALMGFPRGRCHDVEGLSGVSCLLYTSPSPRD